MSSSRPSHARPVTLDTCVMCAVVTFFWFSKYYWCLMQYFFWALSPKIKLINVDMTSTCFLSAGSNNNSVLLVWAFQDAFVVARSRSNIFLSPIHTSSELFSKSLHFGRCLRTFIAYMCSRSLTENQERKLSALYCFRFAYLRLDHFIVSSCSDTHENTNKLLD